MTDKIVVKTLPLHCARCGSTFRDEAQETFSRKTGRKLRLRICPRRLSAEIESTEAVMHDHITERQDGTWEISVG